MNKIERIATLREEFYKDLAEGEVISTQNIKKEYNKILEEYKTEIENLKEEMKTFKKTQLPIIKEDIEIQKKQNKQWFLENFDKIWENRHNFKLGTPNASIIVEGINITSFACPYYGYIVDKIAIGNLVKLWENGFMFRGYPMVHYHRRYNSDYSYIAYIKDQKIIDYEFSKKQPLEEQYEPTEFIQKMLKKIRENQPKDTALYRTIDELKALI